MAEVARGVMVVPLKRWAVALPWASTLHRSAVESPFRSAPCSSGSAAASHPEAATRTGAPMGSPVARGPVSADAS